jgi:uncharacterized protein (DUF427 family)
MCWQRCRAAFATIVAETETACLMPLAITAGTSSAARRGHSRSMSLTVGTGPFSPQPAGRFNTTIQSPTGAFLYWDPVPPRIRAFLGGEPLVDTTRAKLLHETGYLPIYYFPEEDLRRDLLEASQTVSHSPHKGDARYWSIHVRERVVPDAAWAYPEPIESASFLAGHVAFEADALDEWYAEDEQVFGHPRDPYHRIDVYRTTRRVRVLVDGECVADSVRARALFETGLPPRFYLPPADVRLDLLEPSSTKTRCPYKGSASYWHARVGDALHADLAWTYPAPQHDGEPIRDLIAFFNERVDLEVGGARQERPQTQWSSYPSVRGEP